MSWQKILTQLNIKDGATAAGILTSDGSVAINQLNTYPTSNGAQVALGLKHDGSNVVWDLIDDFGDSATANELDATQTSLGAAIAAAGTWDGSTAFSGDSYIANASSITDALKKLDAAVDTASSGGFSPPDGTSDNQVLLWDNAGQSWSNVVTKSTFLSGTQDHSTYLDDIVGELPDTTIQSDDVVLTWTKDGSGSVTSVQQLSTNQWDLAYNWGDHSGAGYLTSETFTQTEFDNSAASSVTSQHITDLGTVNSENANWTLAHGWGDHAQAGYADAITVANNLAATGGTSATSYLINNGAAADTGKIKLDGSHDKKLIVKTVAGVDCTLEVENLSITGTAPIQFEGDATVGPEFVSVNSDFDWSDAGVDDAARYDALILAGGQGLKVYRDPNQDTSNVIDAAKIQWLEQDAAGGKHGHWRASIIYNDGGAVDASQEYVYEAPLVTVLDANDTANFVGDTSGVISNPNLVDDGTNGGFDNQQQYLANASDIGSFFIGTDASVWIKTS